MAIRVTLECGHTSELRAQRTPEGYTHDWQVFVRGVDNAEVHQYIEKVVFHLHETFPKPKRVLKEPPYVVKESGYAGFEIPIYVYLKNKDEPKKFHFSYDLQLQPSGPAINKVATHSETFPNPNEDFRKRLLKGGAIMVSNTEGTPEKSKVAPPMVGKPKLSGTEGKKHRMTEPKASNAFADLFGPPIKTAGTKVSPDTKKPLSSSVSEKNSSTKLSSSEKVEKSEKSSKAKHSPHKDGKKEKNSEERKEKKDRDSSKEKEKIKDKSKRSQSPMSKSSHTSPGTKRPSSPPPIKKPPTPPPSVPKRAPSPKPKEKESKKVTQEKEKEKEKEKLKESSKSTSEESRSEKKKDKKKHKEDKDKEKKDKHKDKERDKSKESKESKSVEKKVEKIEKPEKEKEKPSEFKPPKEGRKSPKPQKEPEKVKEEKPAKPEKVEKNEKPEKTKESKDKDKQKHKHKKREKKDKRDGSKEREKKEKREKNKSSSDKQNVVAPPLPPPPPPPVATTPLSTLLAEMPDRDSSDSAPSLDEEPFVEPKPVPIVKKDPPPVLAPTVSNESKPNMSPPPPSDKKSRSDRSKREKSKGNREDKEVKKRKRRSDSKGDDERAIKKDRDRSSSPLLEPVSSSQSPIAVDMESVHHPKVKDEGTSNKPTTGKGSEAEAEQVAPDSTNSTLAEPEVGDAPSFSEEYVSQLKDLQHKIMTLQDNQELQRVVQVIAETGQYEITKKTFDFDLCTLDRRTVQRLQQFFAS
ncbi:protein ENL [Belonocnema kinseyi]|uniref:protein ENL n=1 Tax=Belonocnema kinseyi TaxID=2817044 RepID=UPI00143DD4B2|nr:protein ENL [Belonocnema kinseyi]